MLTMEVRIAQLNVIGESKSFQTSGRKLCWIKYCGSKVNGTCAWQHFTKIRWTYRNINPPVYSVGKSTFTSKDWVRKVAVIRQWKKVVMTKRKALYLDQWQAGIPPQKTISDKDERANMRLAIPSRGWPPNEGNSNSECNGEIQFPVDWMVTLQKNIS